MDLEQQSNKTERSGFVGADSTHDEIFGLALPICHGRTPTHEAKNHPVLKRMLPHRRLRLADQDMNFNRQHDGARQLRRTPVQLSCSEHAEGRGTRGKLDCEQFVFGTVWWMG